MQKLGWALAGAAAFALAACTDRSDLVSPGRMTPRVPSRATLPATGTGPLTGAIFTTNSACTGVDLNIYASKADVYLDGGPAHPGAAGLPEGDYAVKVTAPDGTLLGTTVGTTNEAPVHVNANGEFAQCYQLTAILRKASTLTLPASPDGYLTTNNPGGEYKVWLSNGADFNPAFVKTDNFKVFDSECTDCGPFGTSTLNVLKFYDANANGLDDDNQPITGWKVNIQDGLNLDRFTPAHVVVAPDEYTVKEYESTIGTWIHTTTNPVVITLADGDDKTVEFGNVCVGAGGGLTLGFWSNKNGQNLFDSGDLAAMVALNLRNANGTDFNPASYSAFRTWILAATATNMANMLSAQLAAMKLNTTNGSPNTFVNPASLIYVGTSWKGTTIAFSGLNSLGFASVADVMTAANLSLGTDGYTVAAGNTRNYQEALKNALDKANNNLNFVQGTPCAFSFASTL